MEVVFSINGKIHKSKSDSRYNQVRGLLNSVISMKTLNYPPKSIFYKADNLETSRFCFDFCL